MVFQVHLGQSRVCIHYSKIQVDQITTRASRSSSLAVFSSLLTNAVNNPNCAAQNETQNTTQTPGQSSPPKYGLQLSLGSSTQTCPGAGHAAPVMPPHAGPSNRLHVPGKSATSPGLTFCGLTMHL